MTNRIKNCSSSVYVLFVCYMWVLILYGILFFSSLFFIYKFLKLNFIIVFEITDYSGGL